MQDYYKKLVNEYDKDPEAFEKRTQQIKEATKEIGNIYKGLKV